MKNKWDKILLELSYRVSSGIPDLTNEQHLMKLWDILKEHKWNIDARVELLKNLNELDFKNKAALAAYAAKHKIRPTTVVNVAGKKSTAGEELPDLKDDEPEPKVEKNQNQERWDEVKESEQSNVKFKIEKGNVIGDIDSGDNKVKQDMLTHGFRGYNEATGKKPAKGSAGSAFQEIVSGQGVKMLFNENKTSE